LILHKKQVCQEWKEIRVCASLEVWNHREISGNIHLAKEYTKECSPLHNFFLGFIASLEYYHLFFTINRSAARWRFFVILGVIILNRPLCAVWLFQGGNFQEPNAIVIAVSIFINLFSLFVCTLLGSNRLRAFVAASFVLSILDAVGISDIYYTAVIVHSLFSKIVSKEIRKREITL
jgi:hypothetical protein